jgi:ABC-type transport system involved in cytochrome c biogenesis permease subunit
VTSDLSLAQLADTLAWLTVLTYLAAAVLLGLELGYRLRRRAAWISATGVAAIAFNVCAVNLWLAGLHSYAT